MKHNLEIDCDLAFHRRFWMVQRIGRVCWILIMIAAVFGLFGPGLTGAKTIRDEKSGMSLTYERLIHHQATEKLKIRVASGSASDSQIRLSVNLSALEAVELLGISPEPATQQSSGTEVFYTFNRAEASAPMMVVFHYEAKKIGKILFQIRCNDHPALVAEQFSFP